MSKSKFISQKQHLISVVKQNIGYSLFLSEFCKISSNQLNQLRREIRARDAYIKVLKNTILNRALKDSEHACLIPYLQGQNILISLKNDDNIGDVSKFLSSFVKQFPDFKIRFCSVGQNKLYTDKDMKFLCSIPSRPEALKMLAQILIMPVFMLANALKNLSDTKNKNINT